MLHKILLNKVNYLTVQDRRRSREAASIVLSLGADRGEVALTGVGYNSLKTSLRSADVLTCVTNRTRTRSVSETGVFPSLDWVSRTFCLSHYVD